VARKHQILGSTVACVFFLALSACDISNDNGDESHKVNGSIHVPAGRAATDVKTVNGSISVEDNGTIDSAGTVNGEIKLGSHASATNLSTVNGSITLADAAHATEAHTINGDVSLAVGAELTGPLINTNGKITVDAAHVGGGISTANGDIRIMGASHVEGGIEVQQVSGGFSLGISKPTVIIGPGATVQGDLIFKRKVRLLVSDRATIGSVTGATAVPFTGDTPP
jgi:cytoskeletal protein CcmA (bactofilin family)